jgi:hypothetical protein
MSDPAARFAVIPLGPDDRAPANAIAHGSWSALAPLIFDHRPLTEALRLAETAVAGAEQLHARALEEQQLVAEGVADMVGKLAGMQRRLDTLEGRKADRHALDAASEAARELLEIPNDEIEPGRHGELVAHPPTQPEDQEQLEAGEREDQGDPPRELNAA